MIPFFFLGIDRVQKKKEFFCLDMMTDTSIQQSTNPNAHLLVTEAERRALIQRLSAKWTLDLLTSVEKQAYEKSQGIKPIYFKLIQDFHQKSSQQNRSTSQQQQQPTGPSLNNNRPFPNQPTHLLQQQQQPSPPILSHPQHSLNHLLNQPQPRFPTVQPRVANPPTAMMTNPAAVRLREPPKSNQALLNSMSYASTSSSIQPLDSPQSYASQSQQMNNATLNEYLSQPSLPQTRFSNQSPLVPPRPRATTSLNANFPSQTSTNNSNDILHQFVVGNTPTNSMANATSTGDRLLQQILLSNNDASSNKKSLQTRTTAPPAMSQTIRSATTTNSTPNNSISTLRSSLGSRQASPSSPVILMPTATQTSNAQIQPIPNIAVQQSSLNNSNGLLPTTTTNAPVIAQPPSVPTNSHASSPVSRPTGSISSPDEETSNLIKFFKDNASKLQIACQKFINEGNLDKARNAQAIHQQMVQFINNPTYENLSNAKHIRDILERALSRPQPTNPPTTTTTTTTTTNPSIPPIPEPKVNAVQHFEKVLTEYVSSDLKKRQFTHEFFVEPLADVINGVPHKKIRLDFDGPSTRVSKAVVSSNQSSLLSKINHELNFLPHNLFSIERLPVSHTSQTMEFNDEYLSRNGLVLRCKLLEQSNPLVRPIRLRVSTRYPEQMPEILSLTDTTPPKLEFSDGDPFFERLSTIFVSYLFKLPCQHTVTDILNIWCRSVQSAL